MTNKEDKINGGNDKEVPFTQLLMGQVMLGGRCDRPDIPVLMEEQQTFRMEFYYDNVELQLNIWHQM